MNATTRLTALAATFVLVAGCAGLQHKDKAPRNQVQPPGAPSLAPGPANAKEPAPAPEKSRFGFSEITPGL